MKSLPPLWHIRTSQTQVCVWGGGGMREGTCRFIVMVYSSIGKAWQLESTTSNMYNFVHAKGSLKESAMRFLILYFFHESASSTPLSIPCGPFQMANGKFLLLLLLLWWCADDQPRTPLHPKKLFTELFMGFLSRNTAIFFLYKQKNEATDGYHQGRNQ